MNRDKRIIILDDDQFQLKLLSRHLGSAGFTNILCCQDAPSALSLLSPEDAQKTILLVDLAMPGMDGVEFVRRLGHWQYQGALVLISGEQGRVLESAEKLARAHRLQVLGYMEKPIVREALVEMLDRWEQGPLLSLRNARKEYAAEEIEGAIKRSELMNYYQPKILFQSGVLAGVETLVRWEHPEDGLVLPDQFISIAEESGVIEALTQRVLTSALDEAVHWREAGLEIQLAVNVSMDNLTNLGFVDFVVQELETRRLDPQKLTLEVTESRLMRNSLTPLEILTRLRLKQISLSIDDFGTGHSSLAQLRDMPFDELKIDRSFVHGVHCNTTLRGILEGSLGMAAKLGMKAVAEGIEDPSDWNYMRETGCDFAQGYYIARPMSAEALHGWINQYSESRGRRISGG